MDEIVARSLAKWPNVPAVYGWLSLDRRGNWRIKEQKIGNPALRDFMSRNYGRDARGRWFFQNGPQRVYVHLAYTPLVVRCEGDGLVDHCNRPFRAGQVFTDDEGSVVIAGEGTVALLDDRELGRFAERLADGGESLPRVRAAELPERYGFTPDPVP
jgi:hypothetical protein